MAAKGYTIQPAVLADSPTLIDLVVHDKLSLTMNQLIFKDWPNTDKQKSVYTGNVERAFRDPSSVPLKAVDDTGNIVGYLLLSRRKPLSSLTSDDTKPEDRMENIKPEETTVPDFMNLAPVKAVNEAVVKLNKPFAEIDRYEITFIVVFAPHRNQGIGTLLTEHCFTVAREASLPICFHVEPQAYTFFKNKGFKDTDHVDWDLAKWAPHEGMGYGWFRLSGLRWDP